MIAFEVEEGLCALEGDVSDTQSKDTHLEELSLASHGLMHPSEHVANVAQRVVSMQLDRSREEGRRWSAASESVQKEGEERRGAVPGEQVEDFPVHTRYSYYPARGRANALELIWSLLKPLYALSHDVAHARLEHNIATERLRWRSRTARRCLLRTSDLERRPSRHFIVAGIEPFR